MLFPGSALEGGAVFEGEGQAAIRVGCGVVQQAAPELFAEGADLAVLLLQDVEEVLHRAAPVEDVADPLGDRVLLGLGVLELLAEGIEALFVLGLVLRYRGVLPDELLDHAVEHFHLRKELLLLGLQLGGVEGLRHALLVGGDGGIPSGQQLVDRHREALFHRGLVKVRRGTLRVNGETVSISISEEKDNVVHEITQAERMRMLEYEEARRKSQYASRPQIPKYDHPWSGRLKIVIQEKHVFEDCNAYVLEDRIGEILISLFEASHTVRLQRMQAEERRREELEESRRKEQIKRRYNEEVDRTMALVNAAQDYSTACMIRAYIEAVRASGAGGTDPDPDWLEWAAQKADWFDPTVAREDEWFEMTDKSGYSHISLDDTVGDVVSHPAFAGFGSLLFSWCDYQDRWYPANVAMYNLVNTVCLTFIQVPFYSMISLMTRNGQERGMLGNIQQIFQTLGNVLINTFFVTLLARFSSSLETENTQAGYTGAILVVVTIMVILNLITVLCTKERVVDDKKGDKKGADDEVKPLVAVKSLLSNKYWVIMFFAMLCIFFVIIFYSIGGVYYSLYIFKDMGQYSWMANSISIAQFAIMFLTPFFMNKFGKRWIYAAGMGFLTIGFLGFGLFGTSKIMMIICNVLKGCGLGMAGGMAMGLVADTITYGQLKTGVNAVGMGNAGTSAAQKLGLGLGTAVFGWVMSGAGFKGEYDLQGIAQPETVETAIRFMYNWVPMIMCAIKAKEIAEKSWQITYEFTKMGAGNVYCYLVNPRSLTRRS